LPEESKSVTFWPIKLVVELSKTVCKVVFIDVICSKEENEANCETNWLESWGFNGSWFSSCVIKRVKKVFSDTNWLLLPVTLDNALARELLLLLTLETLLTLVYLPF
jgi:hypothetical protein